MARCYNRQELADNLLAQKGEFKWRNWPGLTSQKFRETMRWFDSIGITAKSGRGNRRELVVGIDAAMYEILTDPSRPPECELKTAQNVRRAKRELVTRGAWRVTNDPSGLFVGARFNSHDLEMMGQYSRLTAGFTVRKGDRRAVWWHGCWQRINGCGELCPRYAEKFNAKRLFSD